MGNLGILDILLWKSNNAIISGDLTVTLLVLNIDEMVF